MCLKLEIPLDFQMENFIISCSAGYPGLFYMGVSLQGVSEDPDIFRNSTQQAVRVVLILMSLKKPSFLFTPLINSKYMLMSLQTKC